MRRLAVVAVLVVIACGAPPAASQTPPSTGAVPTSAQRASPSGQTGVGGSVAPPTPGHTFPETSPRSLAVLVDLFAGGGAYDIALVAADGRVVTRAHAPKRTPIPDASELPYVSASNSRVYYLDGDRDIRYLKEDGTSGLVTSVPGSSTARAAFAVSPDDSRIAVGLLDFSVRPVALTLYVEDLGGANHAVIFTSTSHYVWPAGWHAGQLVVAYLGPSGAPFNSTMEGASYSGRNRTQYPYGPNPYGGINYHVINPVTAQREVIVSGGGASGLPNQVGTAVVQGDAVDWRGQPLFWNSPYDYGSYSAAGSLSPDGHIIAACCPDPGSAGQLVLWYQNGDRLVVAANATAGDWVGWFDGSHLITGFYQGADGTPGVLDLSRNQVTQVDAHGFVATMLPVSWD